jgi:hypothetical protein
LVAGITKPTFPAHPYIGVEDIELARPHLEGWADERAQLRAEFGVDTSRRWWRPRGVLSALRRLGLRQTRLAHDVARKREEMH